MGTITLTINASTAEELIEHVRDLQGAILGHVTTQKPFEKPDFSGVGKADLGGTSEPSKTEPKKTRAAAPKEKVTPNQEATTSERVGTDVQTTTVPAKTDAVQSGATMEAATGSKTKDDVAKSLQDLTAAKDLAKAKEVLGRFMSPAGVACARMSDIQPKDYEDFIATCEAESKA